jgi:DUF4097 and DUF4098 domain-containing protein YvlB
MQRIALAFGLAAGMVSLVGCDAAEWGDSNRFKEEFHASHGLKAGGRIDLENFNGSVEITGWDKETVEINATRFASTEEGLASLKIDIDSSPDSIRIRTVRPMDRRGNRGVRYVISAPRKAVLGRIESTNGSIRVTQIDGNARLKTTNGAIRADFLTGDLEARTTNGSIEVQQSKGAALLHTTNGSIRADGVKGALEAETTNASVDVRLSEPAPDSTIKVGTTNGRITLALDALRNNNVIADSNNGNITLRLPSNTSARVKAHTSNGSIQNDFQMAVEGPISKHRLEGTIGGGGPLLDLSTSNANIRIERM